MCPGTPEEKANKLFEICVGPVVDNEVQQLEPGEDEEGSAEARKKILESQMLDSNNPRLMHSIKMIIYFSEIYPKKHRMLYMNLYA